MGTGRWKAPRTGSLERLPYTVTSTATCLCSLGAEELWWQMKQETVAFEGAKANRLAREKSPYLLQHQFNPVDWHAWGEEAFAAARKLDRPIFLSIGYSTCHWCHVMERESFENEEVARFLNEQFVS